MVLVAALHRQYEIRRVLSVSLDVREYEDGLVVRHCYGMVDEGRLIICLGS
jgi:hypothetical protein